MSAGVPGPRPTTGVLPHRDFGGAERPTLANWLEAPGSRWSFRHARELFWSERVGAGRGAPTPDTAPWHVDGATADYLERSCTDALVVMHGDTFTEWYAPGVAAEDRHVLFSVTKSVVGLVATALIAQGVLEEDTAVSTYLPETERGGYGNATVRNLLDMTADIRFVEDYDGPDVRRYREAVGQVPSSVSEGIHAYVAGLPAAGEHGRAFSYISPTTDVTGWLCERATGKSLAQLITEHVWVPMGAEHEADLLIDRQGAARASGGLCATARDSARIGRLLLDASDGRPSSWGARDVLRPGDRAAWDAGTLADFLPGAAYRSFWFQPAGEPEVYLAAGIHGQRVYVDVRRGVVITQHACLPTSFDAPTWAQTLPLFRQLAEQFRSR